MLKNKLFVLTLIALLVISFSFVTIKAFAITAPYWGTNPMILNPGQSKTIGFALQNMVGEENITLIGEITEGRDLAEIVDEINEYFVPFGSKDEVIVHVSITMPEDAEMGEEYTVALTLTTVTPSEQGGVALGASIVKEVPVFVGLVPAEPTPTSETNWMVIGISAGIIVILIIILWIIAKRKKKIKKRKKK